MAIRAKMIPVEVMLTVIHTLKQCYEEDKQTIPTLMFKTAITTLNMVEEFVKRTSAVDAREVVPGKWLRGYPIHCSLCGGAAATEYEDANRYEAWQSPYCPHCGQPMEVENDRS